MDSSQLRILADKLVRNIDAGDPLPISCLSEETVNRLSKQTCLVAIVKAIESTENLGLLKIHETVVWAEGLLRNPQGIFQDNTTVHAAVTIQRWTTKALAPPETFAPKSHFDSNTFPISTAIDTLRWVLMAVAGLRLLSYLQLLVPRLNEQPALDLVTSLASFTDPRDPWTRPEAFETANALLVELLRHGRTANPKFLSNLLAGLLQDKVKPSFAKAKNSAITDQGRKANYHLPSAVDLGDSEVQLKAWKFREVYIPTVFQWILGKLDESTIQEHWPLVIPPLLAILDDEAIDNKIKGCSLLVALLKITPPSLLQKTGLGEVFHDALLPWLSFLPSLTPEEQSIRLLDAVYPTLLHLLRIRYPGSELSVQKTAVLDQMVRIGILNGFGHAGEYVKIATILMKWLLELVNEMGIMSVKHFKDLLPLISGVLSAPFCAAHPSLLLAAAAALQAIILNGWPRVGYYQAEILKGLALCWSTMNEDICQSHEVDSVNIAVLRDICLLRESVRTNIVGPRDMDQLFPDNHRLRDLLKSAINVPGRKDLGTFSGDGSSLYAQFCRG